MRLSEDYTDDESSASEDSGPTELVRPILLRKKNETRPAPETNRKITKQQRNREKNLKEVPNIKPTSILFVQQALPSIHDATRKLTADKEASDIDKKMQSTHHFEYGDSVDGYRFVGTRDQYEKWMDQNLKKVSSVGTQDDCEDEPIDSSAFDKNRKTEHNHTKSKDFHVLNYWKRNQGQSLLMPILKHCSLQEVDIGDISKETLERFYLRSCSLLDVQMAIILKKERIFWHPDKVIPRLNTADKAQTDKITKIFQIVNELWESL